MVPEYEVTTTIEVDYASLRVPPPYGVINGFGMNRGYEALVDVTWDEAQECIEAEARWLGQAAKCGSAVEFDSVLGDAPETEAAGDFDYLFRYLDVGVAGLTLVLAAADYATFYSCRGHADIAIDRAPQVGFAAEEARVRLVATLAEQAGCGVHSDESGYVWIYASDVTRMHELAKIGRSPGSGLHGLPPAPWRARVNEVLAHGDFDTFEWNDEEI